MSEEAKVLNDDGPQAMEQREAGEVSWRGEAQAPRQSDGSNESYNPHMRHPPWILGPYAQTSSSQSPRELSGAERQVLRLRADRWECCSPGPGS